MLERVSVAAAAGPLEDLLQRGEAMVANVPSVDRGNCALCAAAHLRKLAEGAGHA